MKKLYTLMAAMALATVSCHAQACELQGSPSVTVMLLNNSADPLYFSVDDNSHVKSITINGGGSDRGDIVVGETDTISVTFKDACSNHHSPVTIKSEDGNTKIGTFSITTSTTSGVEDIDTDDSLYQLIKNSANDGVDVNSMSGSLYHLLG